jgi:hypothetical protein
MSSLSPLMPERPNDRLIRSPSEPNNVPTTLSPKTDPARHSNNTIGSRHTNHQMEDMDPQHDSGDSDGEEELYNRPEYGDSDEDFEGLD